MLFPGFPGRHMNSTSLFRLLGSRLPSGRMAKLTDDYEAALQHLGFRYAGYPPFCWSAKPLPLKSHACSRTADPNSAAFQ